ncbi:MAG: hypothetical protein PHH44_08870, partial [bacterium]|nr:hypothetical protein [bacterium]
MISSKMRYFSIFLFLLISLMLFCNICWAQNILFSLQYGQDDSQIGVYIPDPNIEEEPMGPSYFYVDSSGNFYITDIIANVIKKYGPIGNFILKTEPINSPLYSFCVDNEGNIYIVHGTSCDELTKFNNNGSVLWTKKP